jgi:hypothetical protein
MFEKLVGVAWLEMSELDELEWEDNEEVWKGSYDGPMGYV